MCKSPFESNWSTQNFGFHRLYRLMLFPWLYLMLHGKRNFVDVIKYPYQFILKEEDYPGLSRWLITRALNGGRRRQKRKAQRNVAEGELMKIQSMRSTHNVPFLN